MRLRKACSLFLAQYEHKQATVLAYRKDLQVLVDHLGNRKVHKVTSKHLGSYVEALRKQKLKYADHSRRPVERAPLSVHTLNKRIKSMKTFFRWLHTNGHIAENPALKIKLLEVPKSRRLKAMPDKDFDKVVKHLQAREDWRRLALMLFAGDTGLRAGALANLRISDLRLEQSEYLAYDPKTSKLLEGVYGEAAAAALGRWLRVRPQPDHNYVFCSPYMPYAPPTESSLSRAMRVACKEAGLKKTYSLHALRHRFGYRLARAKVPMSSTQTLMGHSDLKITAVYYRETWEEIQEHARTIATPKQEKVIRLPVIS